MLARASSFLLAALLATGVQKPDERAAWNAPVEPPIDADVFLFNAQSERQFQQALEKQR